MWKGEIKLSLFAYDIILIVKYSKDFIRKIDEHSKIHMEAQKPLNSQNNPNKNNNTEDVATQGYKLYLRDLVTKTMWHSQENRHLEQGNRIEKPGLRPCSSY